MTAEGAVRCHLTMTKAMRCHLTMTVHGQWSMNVSTAMHAEMRRMAGAMLV